MTATVGPAAEPGTDSQLTDAAELANLALRSRVERFYFAEARLIDDRRFSDWLALFADDVRYLAPIRRNRADAEFTEHVPHGLSHFDDDLATLARRVQRMTGGRAWTEDPPSIQRHVITNIEAGHDGDEVVAHSNFQVYRYRLDHEVELFTGHRRDRLRPYGAGFMIAARTIYLDYTTLLANNLNLFL